MAMSSNYGAKILKPKKLTNLFKYFFGEDQARYIIEVENNCLSKVKKILRDGNIYFEEIGVTQEDNFEIDGDLKISTKELFEINNQWYNNF